MTKRDNFFIHRNILAIDPGYSYSNGTGFAIFDDTTHQLKSCGLIRPFAPGLESHSATIEIADKVKKKWEEEVGFSYDPKILVVEHPICCFIKNGIIRADFRTISMLSVLGVRIEERFKPKTILRPYPAEWKKRLNKEQTKNWVLENLDAWSQKILVKGLSETLPNLRHNIFDAVGIGMWAIRQTSSQNNLCGEILA